MTQSIRWLQDEIAERMMQKLEVVKVDPKDVLIVPDFPGKHLSLFAERFSHACIHSIAENNLSNFSLWRSKVFANWRAFFRSGKSVFMDRYLNASKFDIPDNSIDLIFSNLLLQDLDSPEQFLQECWRVLREGGLIVFSYLGPDTGKELKPLDSKLLQLKALQSAWDMHDMGDALVRERFSDPVMDMEYLTLDYENSKLLLADIEGLNLGQGLHPSLQLQDLPKKLTLEVVYGHAWAIGKHLAKAHDNIAYIDANQIRRKTRTDSA